MAEVEEKTAAQTIKDQIAAKQKESIALREKGAQLERELSKAKADAFELRGAIIALQNLLKEIEN